MCYSQSLLHHYLNLIRSDVCIISAIVFKAMVLKIWWLFFLFRIFNEIKMLFPRNWKLTMLSRMNKFELRFLFVHWSRYDHYSFIDTKINRKKSYFRCHKFANNMFRSWTIWKTMWILSNSLITPNKWVGIFFSEIYIWMHKLCCDTDKPNHKCSHDCMRKITKLFAISKQLKRS